MRGWKSWKGLAALTGLLGLVALIAAACGGGPTPTPQVIREEVTRVVEQEREVTRVVEQEREVTRQVVATPTPEKKETIVFSDLNWQSAQVQDRIAAYIAHYGYGYPVDAVFGGTVPLFNGLVNGDTQVTMEIWLPNQQEAWDKALKAGEVISVGKSLPDNWQSAFVVPTYVVEENPGLTSVSDLPDYMDLFATAATAGKARWVTCIPGWACEQVNMLKLEAYGLEDVLEPINPGSGPGLFTDLRGAYQKGEPWLGYLWGPTKPAAELDLTILEEPPYSDQCWAEDKGCAYPTAEILIAVHPSLPGRAPEFVEFLRSWDFKADEFVATSGWIADNEATAGQGAVWYLENHVDTWTQWVSDDVAQNVIDALEAGEAVPLSD